MLTKAMEPTSVLVAFLHFHPLTLETCVYNPTTSMSTFHPRAQQVLVLARKEAERFNQRAVGCEHLLLAMIALGRDTAFIILRSMVGDPEMISKEVGSVLPIVASCLGGDDVFGCFPPPSSMSVLAAAVSASVKTVMPATERNAPSAWIASARSFCNPWGHATISRSRTRCSALTRIG